MAWGDWFRPTNDYGKPQKIWNCFHQNLLHNIPTWCTCPIFPLRVEGFQILFAHSVFSAASARRSLRKKKSAAASALRPSAHLTCDRTPSPRHSLRWATASYSGQGWRDRCINRSRWVAASPPSLTPSFLTWCCICGSGNTWWRRPLETNLI